MLSSLSVRCGLLWRWRLRLHPFGEMERNPLAPSVDPDPAYPVVAAVAHRHLGRVDSGPKGNSEVASRVSACLHARCVQAAQGNRTVDKRLALLTQKHLARHDGHPGLRLRSLPALGFTGLDGREKTDTQPC